MLCQLEDLRLLAAQALREEPSFNVAGSFFDQAVRSGELSGKTLAKVSKHLAKAEQLANKGENGSAVDQLNAAIRALKDSGDQGELKQALQDLADTLAG